MVPRAELVQHRTEHCAGKRRLPGDDGVEGAGERFGAEILLQVARGACLHHLQELVLVGRVGEHDDLGLRHTRADPPRRSDATTAEPGVDNAQPGPLAKGRPQSSARVRGLGADLEAVALEQQPDSLACG